MIPYYEQDGITIYHGDCRGMVKSLAFDCVVTDPPYGIRYSPSQNDKGAWGGKDIRWRHGCARRR